MLSYDSWLEEPYMNVTCNAECGKCRKRDTCGEWEVCVECGSLNPGEDMHEGSDGFYCENCKRLIGDAMKYTQEEEE
jgi:hypothetical protein